MGKDCCGGKPQNQANTGKDCCGKPRSNPTATVPKKAAQATAATKAAKSASPTVTAAKAAKKGLAAKIIEQEMEEDSEDFDEDDIIEAGGFDRAEMAKQMVAQLKAAAATKFEALPTAMKVKIQALKKLQADYDENKKNFDEEIFALEKKYAELNKPLFDKRSKIVAGEVTVSASDLKEDDRANYTPSTDDTKGIPDFWLTVLQNSEVEDLIVDYDIPALKHLTNIECINHKKEYEILFHFSENEFFTNKVLKKSYVFEENEEGTQEQPHCIVGTEINWKSGKNLTVETKTIKPKSKKKGKAAKPITKTEPRASFFNFFESHEFPDEEASDAEEDMEEFHFDFELGDEIRERVIPLAVLYYTGEMVRVPDFSGMEGDDEDELDEDFDDEDFEDSEEEEEAPKLVASKKGSKKAAKKGGESLESVFKQQKQADLPPPECKQQ